MKNRKMLLGMLIVMLVFGFMLTGCEEPAETYEIWINTFKWEASDADFGDLADNYYLVKKITKSSYEYEKQNNYVDKGVTANEWTKDDIISYLEGKGFSNSVASDATDAFIANDYSLLGIRKGNDLIVLLK